MTGFGTVPILIIAGIVILSNFIITMVLLSKGSTAAKIIAANDKSPSENQEAYIEKKKIKTTTTLISKSKI
jgi:hypothetical protein